TAYDQLFVPALFQEWAPRVAAAAELLPGQRVLDVACGTGVMSREAAGCVGARGSVVGLDRNPGMLAVANRRNPGITWQEGTAEALPYRDAFFDAVVSQFGLIFFYPCNGWIKTLFINKMRKKWRKQTQGFMSYIYRWLTTISPPILENLKESQRLLDEP